MFLKAFLDGSLGEDKGKEQTKTKEDVKFDDFELAKTLENTKNIKKTNLHAFANSKTTDLMLFVYTSNTEDPGHQM